VSESVINAILEGTLPADLRDTDWSLSRVPPDKVVLTNLFSVMFLALCIFYVQFQFTLALFIENMHYMFWPN
jgi:hypothetical protein